MAAYLVFLWILLDGSRRRAKKRLREATDQKQLPKRDDETTAAAVGRYLFEALSPVAAVDYQADDEVRCLTAQVLTKADDWRKAA